MAATGKGKGDAPRAAIYVRISEDTEGAGAGVARQERECRAFCARRDWPVLDVYTDNDVSASAFTRKARPAYAAMLEAVKAGDVDAIVAWHFDRLYRRPRELEDLIDVAERVTVATLHGDYDLTSSDGRMHARILASVGANESDKISRRVKAAKAERAERGDVAGGQRAFGYESDNVTVRADEAAALTTAARAVLGGRSMRSICAEWTATGLRTPRGKAWHPTVLRSMLTNPRHAGLRVHQGAVVGDGTWPAIIDRATHERLVSLCSSRLAPKARRRGLLTGLVVCGGCGFVMYRDGDSWRCRVRVEQPEANCGRVSMRAPDLEGLVVEAALRLLERPSGLRAAIRKRERGAPAADDDTAGELVDVEDRLRELAEEWAAGRVTSGERLAARKVLDERHRELRDRLASRTGDAVVERMLGVEDVRGRFETRDVDERGALLRALIEAVEIAPTDRRGRGVTADARLERVTIRWVDATT
jgi:site-specific DNA recombinase